VAPGAGSETGGRKGVGFKFASLSGANEGEDTMRNGIFARKALLKTTTMLALSLAAAANARDLDRGHTGYPQPFQMERVAWIAHEIESRTEQALDSRRSDGAADAAQASLQDLREAARRFCLQVNTHRQEPRETTDEFQALLDRFYATAEAPRARLESDGGMDRIYRLMTELASFYGRYDEYRDWAREHGRARGFVRWRF
jgi:hypothetical protein